MSITMVRKKHEESSNYLFEQKFGKPFEDFDTVKTATEALSNGTQIAYCKDLPEFFLWLGENPDQVFTNRKIQVKADDETSDHYERKVRAYKKYLEEKNQTGRYIAGKIGRIQGFFKNNSARYKLELGSMKYNEKRKTPKYSPKNEVCREIYSFADSARDRLIVALAFQNGLAPVDIAENDYSNFPTEPFKYYQGGREKNGKLWHGVTTPEIVQEFLAYKKIRGEPAKDEPLFKGREGFLDSAGISQIISTVMKKAGYGDVTGFSPKSMRDGFKNALMSAGVDKEIREAMMGHVNGIAHEYGGQEQLEAGLEECMQKAYKFLMLTEVVNTNGKSAQKISDLDNAVVESQKEIAALKTINSSLTERLAKTEDMFGLFKALAIPLFDDNLLSLKVKLEGMQKELQDGTAVDPAYTAMVIEGFKVSIEQRENTIKRLKDSA